MSNFTDVFSNGLIPPSSDAYSSITINTDQRLVWPYNYNGTSLLLTKILDVSCSVGNKLYLPAVAAVSTGESAIIRNTGANSLQILDFEGHSLFTLLPGIAQYFWVIDNAIESSSSWGQVTYGAGTSTAAAADLAGKGLTVDSGKLAVNSPMIYCTALTVVLQNSSRGAILNFNQGAAALQLGPGSGYSNGFYCFVKNSGAGSVVISSTVSEPLDGQLTLTLQPMESLILMYSGGEWYSVGYGRSTLYQFSQLLLDVSAGGTFTLSYAQASNKMLTFIGSPASAVAVQVPAIVAVYYLACNITTAVNVQVSTPSDAGIVLHQNQRSVILCDGATVAAAQSASVTTALSMLNGTEAAPALNFASKTNTGIYKYSTQGIGFSVNGVSQWYSNGGGTTFPLLTTLLGNQTFGGTGQRITGDMSNATLANRLIFQSSVVNGNSAVSVIPNGTAVGANINAFNSADPDNASQARLSVNATQVSLASTKTGTGTYKPFVLNVGGADVASYGEAAATLGNMTANVSRDSNLAYLIQNLNAGVSAGSVHQMQSNTGYLTISKLSAASGLAGGGSVYNSGGSLYIGTTDTGQLLLITNGTLAAGLDSAGNFLLYKATGGLGYGAGAGGTVTQTTSKSTTVSINRPFGQITMNNAALAAGASVSFLLSNSLVTANDGVSAIGTYAAAVNPINYRVEVASVYGTVAVIRVTNITAGSLSEALAINFWVTKGAIA